MRDPSTRRQSAHLWLAAVRAGGLAVFVVLGACRDTTTAPPDTEATVGAQLPGGPGWGSAGVEDYDASVAIAWFELAAQLVEAERWSPPVASRAFGIAGVALYETLVPGMRGARALAGQLRDWPGAVQARGPCHWPTVVNAAMASTWRGLFAGAAPATMARLEALARDTAAGFAAPLPPGIEARSVAQGETVSRAVLAWAALDGFATLHGCVHTALEGPGLWQPTAPGFAPALEPCWGDLRPFVLGDASACDPGPPPPFSTAEGTPFMNEVHEVYATSLQLTPEQSAIAHFWADGPGTVTPPGHSIAIANQILAQRAARLDQAAETYARLGIAVADAFISCWRSKYRYDLLRPITCIRNTLDPNWNPLLLTPPFPEYPSGHSVQSGAAAAVLTALFGDLSFTDHTHEARGFAPRHFASFDAAAQEAALSRLYAGIHYRSAIERGLEQGRCVGAQVNALFLRAGLRK